MKVRDRFCLFRCCDGSFGWHKVPEGASEPKIGDECFDHEWLSNYEGGVVIAVLDADDEANGLLALVDLLGALVETYFDERGGCDEFMFNRMLDRLMQHAADGSAATEAKRAEVKKLIEAV